MTAAFVDKQENNRTRTMENLDGKLKNVETAMSRLSREPTLCKLYLLLPPVNYEFLTVITELNESKKNFPGPVQIFPAGYAAISCS